MCVETIMLDPQTNLKIGKMLVESSSTLIWIADDSKHCVYFNKAWLDFRGRTLEEEYGYGWADGVHPDDYQRCLDIYVAAFDKREKFSMSYRLKSANGEYRWIQDNGDPYFENDQFVGYIGSCYDIHDFILAQKQLKQSNEILKNVTNSINDVFWFSDLHGHATYYVSPAIQSLWGLKPEDIYENPQRYLDAILEDDLPGYLAVIEKHHKKGTEYQHKYRIKSPANSILVIQERGYPVLDESGKPAFMAGLCTDVTELHQAKITSKTLEGLLDVAGSVASIGYWEYTPESHTLTWSNEMFNIFERDQAAFTLSMSSFFGFFSESTRKRLHLSFDKLLDQKVSISEDLTIEVKSGKSKHLILSATVALDESGLVKSVVGIVQDVTLLKTTTSEKELLSRAVEFTNTGIIITDKAQRVIWSNNAFTKLTGYELDEIKGHTLGRFLQGEDTDKNTVERIKQALANEENVNVEILNYHKNGTTYWNNLYITPVYTNHQVSHFIGIQNDITEYKAQREQLSRLKRVETLNELAAGIAHDINNILGVIEGNRELIEMKLGEASVVSANIESIGRAVDRAKQTTSKLLRTSKQLKAIKKVFQIDEVLVELNTLLSEIIPNNIELTLTCDSHAKVLSSKTDLEDALTNIIVNAKNAIQHHGKIAISCTDQETFHPLLDSFIFAAPRQSERYIVITIQDTGIGIANANIEKIFTPFVSFNNAATSTGLGLAMVAGYVAREELGLIVKSIQGKGTEIQLWLPIDEINQKQILAETSFAQEANQSINLVLIDDEVELLSTSTQLLGQRGFNVQPFSCSKAASEYIKAHLDEIDIIITDEVMPGEVQGHDIYETFHKAIPVVIATGFANEYPISIESKSVLQKPYSLTQLITCIDVNTRNKNKKSYKIWVDKQVLYAELEGAWGSDIAQNFANDFKDAATAFNDDWGHLVYLDGWELCSEEMIKIIQDLVDWCIENGLKRAAQVYAPSMVKKEFLDEMVVEEFGEFKRAVFGNAVDAKNWLENEGFNTTI